MLHKIMLSNQERIIVFDTHTCASELLPGASFLFDYVNFFVKDLFNLA